jgi:inosine-uridine nucleoside N-ribohydrolase
MARKVVLDVDPGIVDALAITLALFEPELEVIALTSVAGNVPAEMSTRNVQSIVEQLDPPRLPRIGAAVEPEQGPIIDNLRLHGPDGMGNAQLPVAELHHQHSSEKVLADVIRGAGDGLTIICLGPLTNLAHVLRRDPSLAGQIGHVIIQGGAISAPGNATAVAEFNLYCDPLAAREVFRSPLTKTLIPLDVTRQVVMDFGHLSRLPPPESRAADFLHRLLPYSFRTHRQFFGLEGIYVHEAVALIAALRPELFTTERMAGDVETQGELTSGASVFDRRLLPEWRPNIDVAVEVDTAGVQAALLASIEQAARASA